MKNSVITFKRTLKATPEHVWRCLTEQNMYKQWADVFSPGNYFEGTWATSEEIIFIDPKSGGTVAKIVKFEPFKRIHLTHTYMLTEEGKRDDCSENGKRWVGTIENYELEELIVGTQLTVHIECDAIFEDFFKESWEKALDKMATILKNT